MATDWYSISNVTGFKERFGSEDIYLPLKYGEKPPRSSNQEFNLKLSTSGTIINLKDNYNNFIDSIGLDVSNDLKTISLTPINVQYNHLNLELQRLSIHLPNKLVSSNCLTYSIHKDINHDNELQLVVDFIDDRYLFITVAINIDDFIVNNNYKFQRNNFKAWGNISIPYSFELRSSPHLLKSLDSNNCIVSLRDGGLLHFQRPSPLQDFDVYNFNESSGGVSLNLFHNIFKSYNNNKSGLTSLSPNTIADFIAHENCLITLSVSKTVKFWDLSDHNQVLKSFGLDEEDNNYLNSIPEKYFYRIENNKHTYLIFLCSTTFNENGIVFNIWDITDLGKIKQNKCTLNVPIMESGYDYRNNLWFIQDFFVKPEDTDLQLYILWKSNISSVLIEYQIDQDFELVSYKKSLSFDYNDNFLQSYDEGYYENKILKSGSYDKLTLISSINILRERLNLSLVSESDLLIKETVALLHDNGKTKNPWFILNSLCEEFTNLSKETLSLTFVGNQMISYQTNGIGIFRPLHYLEKFTINKSDALNNILNSIEMKISIKTIERINKFLCSIDSVDFETLLYINKEFVGDKISNEEEIEIINILSSYSNPSETIKYLITDDQFSKKLENHELSLAYAEFILVSFKDIKLIHEKLLIILLLFLSSFKNDDGILELCKMAFKRIKNYKKITRIMELDKKMLLRTINQGDFNSKFNYLNNKIDNEEFIIQVIFELLSNNESDTIIKEFLPTIDLEKNKLLVGLCYLINKDLSKVDLLDYSNFNSQVIEHLKTINHGVLAPFISNISQDQSESNYYHSLSSLLNLIVVTDDKKSEFSNKAIDFELKSIELLDNKSKINEYHVNIFNLSIESLNIDKLLVCLSNLQLDPRFNQLVKTFILKLNEQKLTKYLFTNEFLKANSKLIDLILIEVAESQLLINSIKFYEILYAWRLFNNLDDFKIFDKRGSMEALYLFITRFERESYTLDSKNLKLIYVKILEFYLIILNGLKGFKNNDDQWLIKYDTERKLLTLNDLQHEYVSYLKRLNDI